VTLEFAIKIFGWAMALAPIVVALGVSANLILGAANDDEEIKALVMLGFAITLLGATILLLVYFTDIFVGGSGLADVFIESYNKSYTTQARYRA